MKWSLDKALDEMYDWCIALPNIRRKARQICKTGTMGPVAPIHIGTDAIAWVTNLAY